MPRTLIEILNQPIASQLPKSMVRPSKRPWEPGRRRGGGIRFWDLGSILDGAEYITLPYVDPYLPSSHYTENLAVASNPPFVRLQTNITHHAALETLIQDVPLAEWKDNYRLIKDEEYTAVQFGMIVTYKGNAYAVKGSPTWVDGVFKPNIAPVDNSFSIVSDIASFQAISAAGDKITSVYDYSASAVPFTPTASMDVFLVPTLRAAEGSVSILYVGGPVIPGVSPSQTRTYLDQFQVVFPRRVVNDPSYAFFDCLYHGGVVQYSGLYSTLSGVPLEYTRAWNLIRLWQDTHPTFGREYVQVLGGNWSASSYPPGSVAVGADYPDPPSLPTSPGLVTSVSGAYGGNLPVPGTLKAVIRNGGAYYYFWQT